MLNFADLLGFLLLQVAQVPSGQAYQLPPDAVIMTQTELYVVCIVWLVVGMLIPSMLVLFIAPDTLKIILAKIWRRPLLMIHFADRHTILRLGSKTDAEHICFVIAGKIYRIDSRIYREGKADNYRGIDLIHYYINSLFPIGAGEAKAVADTLAYVRNAVWEEDQWKQVVDPVTRRPLYEDVIDEATGEPKKGADGKVLRRKQMRLVHAKGDIKFPFLSTLPDKALINALFMPDDELEKDVKVFVKIDTHGLDKNEAKAKRDAFGIGIIEDCRVAKLDLSMMHVASGGFNYQAAAQLVNNELTARLVDDLAKAMMTMKMDWGRQIAQVAPWIAIIVAVLIAGALAYKIMFPA